MTRYNINLQIITLIFSVLFSINFISAQNSCDGTIDIDWTLGNYGAGLQLGNGTPGNVQICITNNNLISGGMGCANAQFVLSPVNGASYQVIWSESTPNGTCYTVTTGSSGYAWIALNCEATGSTATISWSTVDGSGNSLCLETCSDGILNQDETGIDCGGTFCIPCSCSNGVLDAGETGIDCGGPCNPCGTCFDGIQNGSETGIDCGGSCALICSTNSTTVGSETCCDASPIATVYPTNCDQIGTSAYNLNSPEITINSNPAACIPSTPSGCGAYGSEGTWTQVDLAPGVDYLQMAPVSVQGFGTGNSITYHAYFQGTDCANLTYVDCQPAIQFSAGGYYFFESSVSGLDPNQNVWVYTWNNSNKYFDYTIQAVGAMTSTNTDTDGDYCNDQSLAIGDACNLGAVGAGFNTPGSQGVACSGGNWGSNENTTFYSFVADALTGSLEVQNIICNDGTNGAAQFAVWTSCTSIGTYGADFLGCAVGTASITLSPLVIGQTYYVVADGYAGNNCTWSFSGTGILLPIELESMNAYHNGREVEVYWSTITEENNDYFTVQRTLDGRDYEDIGFVSGAGNSHEIKDYAFIDPFPYDGTSYYRIRQTDYDGQFSYSEVVSVHNGKNGLTIVRTVNLMGQEVDQNYKGMVIDVFSDGSTTKRMAF